MKDKLKLLYNGICDVLEIYLPCLIFLFLFLSYVVIIFYRYILSKSFSWLYELNTLSFVWCGIFAASYGSRTDSHVQFTIIYDHVPPFLKTVMRIVGNIVIIATFVFMFPKAAKNLSFMKIRKSSILKIPYNLVFSPFLIFMVLTLLHSALNLLKDVIGLFNSKKDIV